MKQRNPLSVLLVSATILASVVATSNALAQRLTREHVRAELEQARRSGELRIGGEANLRLRDLSPGMYAAAPASTARTRDEVRSDLASAIRAGDLVRVGELGLTESQIALSRYSTRPGPDGKSRQQVREELAVALRVGDMPAGEIGLTLAEVFPARFAAERARYEQVMNAKAVQPAASVTLEPATR